MLGFIKKNIAWLYVVATVGLMVYLYTTLKAQKDEIDRYKNNTEALLTDIDRYKTESGKNAVRVQELELTADEFKRLCDEQRKTISDMDIKLKYLQSVSTTVIETNVNTNTKLRDSIIYRYVDSAIRKDSVKFFSWHDRWNSINGVIYDDNVDCTYRGNDTITVAAKRVPKKFLFFRYGTKYIEIDAVNTNPSSIITYNKTVRIKR